MAISGKNPAIKKGNISEKGSTAGNKEAKGSATSAMNKSVKTTKVPDRPAKTPANKFEGSKDKAGMYKKSTKSSYFVKNYGAGIINSDKSTGPESKSKGQDRGNVRLKDEISGEGNLRPSSGKSSMMKSKKDM